MVFFGVTIPCTIWLQFHMTIGNKRDLKKWKECERMEEKEAKRKFHVSFPFIYHFILGKYISNLVIVVLIFWPNPTLTFHCKFIVFKSKIRHFPHSIMYKTEDTTNKATMKDIIQKNYNPNTPHIYIFTLAHGIIMQMCVKVL